MENQIVQSNHPEIHPVAEKDFDIDAFIEKRKEFIEKVNAIMIEGKDYHVIQGRKSMAKGGAEKIASIFGWTATFEKDSDAMEAFSELKDAGIICFVCNLSKNSELVGQGRGAAALAKNGGDPNKTLKMAQKSAFVDAVVRSSGLSDFYTQDLEDMPADSVGGSYPSSTQPQNAQQRSNLGAKQGVVEGQVSIRNPNHPMTQAQLTTIRKLMDQKGCNVDDMIDLGFGTIEQMTKGTASEAIGYLIKAKSKNDVNGNRMNDVSGEDYPNDYDM